MAKTKEQKVKIVEELENKISKSKSIFFVNYEKLTVPEIQTLRRKLKKEMADYFVAKKTLFKLACQKAKLNIDPKKIEGNFALVFSLGDEVAPTKVITGFAKENENLKIVGGILGNEFIPAEKVIALSKLPSRPELLAKFIGCINSPVYGFVNVLAGNIRGLINILNEIKNKMGTE
jgi:large subunit ribosomal protein L10